MVMTRVDVCGDSVRAVIVVLWGKCLLAKTQLQGKT
jgi:hypothetical protein